MALNCRSLFVYVASASSGVERGRLQSSRAFFAVSTVSIQTSTSMISDMTMFAHAADAVAASRVRGQ